MWSDNDIDKAFQRLGPPEPGGPTPFPLDAWLRLESELDQAVIARTVRRKLWRYFAAEVAVVVLVGLAWLLWPTGLVAPKIAPKIVAQVPVENPTTAHLAVGTSLPSRAAATPQLPGASSAAEPGAPAAPKAPAAPGNTAAAPATTLRTATPPLLASAPPARPHAGLAVGAQPNRKPRRLLAKSTDRNIVRFEARPAPIAAPPARRASPPTKDATDAQALARTAKLAALEGPDTKMSLGGAATTPATSAAEFDSTASETARKATGGYRSGFAEATQLVAGGSRQVVGGAAAGAVVSPGSAHNGSAQVAEGATPDGAALVPQVAALPPASWPALPALLTPVALPEPRVPAPLPQRRLFIGLMGAPDISTVKFANMQRPMLNVGLTLEYRLGTRLRITTGVLRANKDYYALREDYDFSAYPSAYSRAFKWVGAACTVVDVPLNLRYDLLVGPQHRFFGSAGLSSFFMQREFYSYNYQENNLDKQWKTETVNANHHLFSVLNLSVGYERHLGSRWSVQAEPYAKLPFTGIGLGKVRLTSAGVFVGVKYGL